MTKKENRYKKRLAEIDRTMKDLRQDIMTGIKTEMEARELTKFVYDTPVFALLDGRNTFVTGIIIEDGNILLKLGSGWERYFHVLNIACQEGVYSTFIKDINNSDKYTVKPDIYTPVKSKDKAEELVLKKSYELGINRGEGNCEYTSTIKIDTKDGKANAICFSNFNRKIDVICAWDEEYGDDEAPEMNVVVVRGTNKKGE